MDKRMRTNLLLAGAVAALALVIWLAPAPEQEDPGIPLFGAGEEISRIEVRENGAMRLALERHDGEWRLTQPYEIPADRFQVDGLINALRQPAERRYALAEADLEQMELVEPRWKISVNGEELAIGGRAAIGNNRYVRKGEHVYLLNDTFSYRLQREPLDYAAKQLLPENVEIAAIGLPAGQRIEKTDSGWQLVPENDAVSADDVQALANAWRNANALRVRAAGEAPEGEQAVVELANGERIAFTVEMNDSSFALIRNEPPLRYEMVRDDARRLLQLEVASRTESAAENP